jgi:glutamate-1-semialdehyde 2,1-aminomutase
MSLTAPSTTPVTHADSGTLTTERGRRLDELIAAEESLFLQRQPRSTALIERARRHLAGGATSNWQIASPQSVWLSHGKGSKLYDVDGTEYVDLHGGYGVSLAGHANPAIVAAVRERVALGTHFAQPTPDAIDVAENLAERFELPMWRFTNSGTEATMDTIHLMRAVTGRDLIIKLEGGYHGHHDSVQVSVMPDEDEAGPADNPLQVASSSGIPQAIRDLTLVVAFNDVDMVRRVLEAHPGQVAGMILEPVMMNAGIILPRDGYLAELKALLHSHGALLAFDEVKTGFTSGPRGVTGIYGVTPDIIALAKALGGGLSSAAIGGTNEVMSAIADGRYEQVGTFNGNPLAMAASKAMLTQVLTPAAYAQIDALRRRMVDGVQAVIAQHDAPWGVVALGAKGCVTFTPHAVTDYRGFLDIDERLGQLHWLVQHNGGVFLPPWGKCEQWTLSVQHTLDDVERFVTNLETFAVSLRGAR